jgi:acetyl-CoA synthetase
MAEADIKWFTNAKVNIENCIDRHLAKKGDKTAIIFEPNDPNKKLCIFRIMSTNGLKKWQMS